MQLNVLQLNKDSKEIIVFDSKEERIKVIASLDSSPKTTSRPTKSARFLKKFIHAFIFSTVDYCNGLIWSAHSERCC